MPTVYKRKCPSRGNWTQDQLNSAITNVKENKMTLREACRTFGIPPRTLKRRIANNNTVKAGMGPSSVLGAEAEKKIVAHIIKLQRHGFSPSRHDVREMAFRLAERLLINHKFDRVKGLAGYDWLNSFLRRNPQLAIRKAEGLSKQRSDGMNRETVAQYFDLLRKIMEENELFDKPSNIYNMDETGMQLNNKPGNVIAQKGSKVVSTLTAAEKGETITVITCCNAEGVFLPPACIFKGKNLKKEFMDGMPPGSQVYMSPKSAYINSELFLKWLKEHFYPRKSAGKTLLIFDGHASHCNNLETLQFAEDNDIILLCLPPHTTHYLQPLDRSVFKSLKSAFNTVSNNWIKIHSDRKISRLAFGSLLNQAWCRAATVQNALSGFSAAGIYPYNPLAVPDYAFVEVRRADPEQVQIADQTPNQEQQHFENLEEGGTPENRTFQDEHCQNLDPVAIHAGSRSVSPPVIQTETTSDIITPGKILNQELPIPETLVDVKTRGKRVAEILTSPENLAKRNAVQQKRKKQKLLRPTPSYRITELGKPGPSKKKSTSQGQLKRKKRSKQTTSTSSDTSDDVLLHDSTDDDYEDDQSTCCIGCGEEYLKTKKKDDWLQCIHCSQWMHECCSKFANVCEICARILLKKKES